MSNLDIESNEYIRLKQTFYYAVLETTYILANINSYDDIVECLEDMNIEIEDFLKKSGY